MAAEPRFDPEMGIWVIRLTGSVSVEDALEASRTIDASASPLRDAPRLWDARAVGEGPTVGSKDLRGLAAGPDAKEARGRVAVVVRRDVDFGLARMYEAYVAESPAELRVFREYSEAVAWLVSG